MQYFAAEDLGLKECQQACLQDVTCQAFAHSFFSRSCHLHTYLRSEVQPGWLLQVDLGITRPATSISRALVKSAGEPDFVCHVKVQAGEGYAGEGRFDLAIQSFLIMVATVGICSSLIFRMLRKSNRRRAPYSTNDIAASGSPCSRPSSSSIEARDRPSTSAPSRRINDSYVLSGAHSAGDAYNADGLALPLPVHYANAPLPPDEPASLDIVQPPPPDEPVSLDIVPPPPPDGPASLDIAPPLPPDEPMSLDIGSPLRPGTRGKDRVTSDMLSGSDMRFMTEPEELS
eukprot:GEMP01012185.1.p2 GENE.GEMP01012185.1~~GEMP01012185.1.p2  ORF type:complete len:287 (+),score=60.86 GEMP01012185.1:1246-2106(+)